MNNKGIGLALVIALGIFLGILVVSNQKNDAALNQILSKQTQILNSQTKLETKMESGSGKDVSQLEARLAAVEARLAKLEAGGAVAAAGGARPPMPQQPPMPDPNIIHEIPLAHSVPGGAKSGKVVITEFVDYQCPFCSRFHDPMIEAAKAYPDKVTYVLKHYPLSFHPQAKPAAKAALAAGEQGKFWEMTDHILKNQQGLNDQAYEGFAQAIGLNVEKFKTDLKNKDADYEKTIQRDLELGGTVGVRGTPSFYINGKVSNARDAATWKTEIDNLLK